MKNEPCVIRREPKAAEGSQSRFFAGQARLRMTVALIFLFLAMTSSCWAIYSDEIAVSQDEVWKAAVEAFKPYGLRKADAKKKQIETKWIYDNVLRSGGLLKRIAKEEYERRYRMKIKIADRAGDTKVEIRGVFQQRHQSLNPQISWTLIRPRADDLDVERDFFMKILSRIEKNRTS